MQYLERAVATAGIPSRQVEYFQNVDGIGRLSSAQSPKSKMERHDGWTKDEMATGRENDCGGRGSERL